VPSLTSTTALVPTPPSEEPHGRPFDAVGFLDDQDVDTPRSRLLNPYYAVKPMLPRAAQLAVRRLYARRQARRRFPAWPIETLRVDQLKNRLRAELEATGVERVPFVNFWPERQRFAFILTHDVEGPRGIENIPRLLEIERRHGLRSSWNFVADDYPIDPSVFAALREAGCEIGLHGLHHDGLLFADRASFEAQLPRIQQVMADWGAVGFRSPATHRERAWMPELGCLYDTSFPDTDPFEPQPGGCCSIWPFFLGDLVELPITMVQDHTLFEILRETSIQHWVQKSGWLAANHGLVNVLVHPDYLLSDRRLDLYEQLLDHLAALPEGWHALPREVAGWWRNRAGLERGRAIPFDPAMTVGPTVRASTAYARKEGDEIVFEL
jgi:peptidoglycan/xylan/chitin deacetylase (PgdA/CDA1 family)